MWKKMLWYRKPADIVAEEVVIVAAAATVDTTPWTMVLPKK